MGRFRLVVESAPNAIVMVNGEGNILLVNSQTEESFGYRREDIPALVAHILTEQGPRRRRPGHQPAGAVPAVGQVRHPR